MFLTFNHSVRLTNFFKPEIPGAFAFRLDCLHTWGLRFGFVVRSEARLCRQDPAIVLKDRPASLYPEIPYGTLGAIASLSFAGYRVSAKS